MVTLSSFSSVLAGLRVPKTASVAVAVSGGSDSVALTYLAKNTFKRVLGVTVDHQCACLYWLRAESSDEAERAKEIVTKMGLEHHLVKLEWPEGPPPLGKTQVMCREGRYSVLLEACEEQKVDLLMTGHHLNDQIETFLYRMARSSGITGLAGIRPLVYFKGHPKIPVIRPLLNYPKEALSNLCRQNGLEWVEDPSNSFPAYWRNAIRQAMVDYPDMHAGIAGIMKTCSEARNMMEEQVVKALNSMVTINNKYGCVYVDHEQFKLLSSPVAIRSLQAILSFVSGQFKLVKTRHLQLMHTNLRDLANAIPTTAHRCIAFPVNDQIFTVARALPQRHERRLIPLKVGETIIWDNRFQITLNPLEEMKAPSRHTANRRAGMLRVPSADEVRKKTFYVRHWTQTDDELAVKGVRRVKSTVLPPIRVRGGLPVILDEQKQPVAIPHYKMVDTLAGVSCDCIFKPACTLEEMFSHLNVHFST